MLVVIADHTPVIATVQRMIDVREVVAGDFASFIDPNFSSELTIPAFGRDVVNIIDDLSISHDELCHGCFVEGMPGTGK